jgi:hypothetical protein
MMFEFASGGGADTKLMPIALDNFIKVNPYRLIAD